MRLRGSLVVVTALILAACGSSSTASHPSPSHKTSTPSAAPSGAVPFPSPTATAGAVPPVSASCTAPPAAGQQLALVSLRGVPGVVVRDITDIGHPTTRCTINGGSSFRFVSATRLSYIDPAAPWSPLARTM